MSHESRPVTSSFRKRLLNKDPIIGTFLKTPSTIVCEVLGMTQLDVVCIDAEHAPFGRLEIDSSIATLRTKDMPALVRVPSGAPHEVLTALDSGATGIVVPHVCSAEQAKSIVKSAHYGRGGRGYAGSTRAADYTSKPMKDHLKDSANQTAVIMQIEDIEAVAAIDEIAAVQGIDCLFIGRIDLTVAYGANTPDDPRVVEAVEKICAAGKKAGVAVGMFVPNVTEANIWLAKGASLFLLASDHNFVVQGANALATSFKEMV